MSLYIDRKYVLLVSTKLEHFKQKSEYLFNCRCKLCGDSKKHTHKTRGYFYRVKGNLFYKCHNCHASMSLGTFLKTVDPNLFSEYQMDRYKEESCGNVARPSFDFVTSRPVFEKKATINLPTIASLPDGHFAKEYIRGRKIPEKRWTDLYFAENFKSFCDEMYPKHDKKLLEEPRLVIPFFDSKKILQGVQGRAFGESKIRYITIRAREDMVKVYGLDKVDFKKPIYVVEGPIDSLFLENSIASMDSALHRVIKLIGEHDFVFVYDNEPRNKETTKTMRETISMGKKVCIWPSYIEQKDINEMVLAGHDPQSIIDKHTQQGAKALLDFAVWKKT